MIKVVCNSSPIIGLSIIKKLDLILLRSIGLMGILLLAKEYEKIESVKKYLNILTESGFRMSVKLYNQVLKLAGEIE
ncbi:hypothetical protein CLTEP_20650 [Clostridium tepidiprofundi DSM 19306]|uniref:DUF3368 domain-containing protein n=1 Tax=Clostridium tepidiprofundi DSM 19306 TaxID=1121338 RepID=A0A151B2K2_9CLOT|nr:DUF3368 domain-containing protein [Clostridium tepidiprofundi]KYH34013.1 hypothetical protein CLTEP_20650 [Clostridium tepidiprofundi DSM 19306]